jgi:hypothetical protein
VEAAQYEHHNRSVREPAGTPHRWGSLSTLFHHFFLSLAPFFASRISVRWHHAMVYGSPQKKGAPTH